MAGWSGYSEKGQGGEERGPATFAFAPPGVPQQQGTQATQARMGYQAAPSVGGLTQYNDTDKTAEAIFGFAESLLKPVAQEVASRKFLEGVQRAASGEQLTEIVNTQPWYSRIFGPSSAVEGARQYTLDAQAAKFDAAVEQAMPTLRNTSPDELPGILQTMSKEYETGDTATDTALSMRLLKTLPNIVQRQTREFYKQQQENANTARFDAWQGLGTSFQVTAQADMASEDDKLLREGLLLQALQLPPGVDPESWKQSLGTFASSLAEQGQFHTLAAVQNSGVLRNLTPEKRLQLERSVNSFKQQAARSAIDDYMEPLATIKLKAMNNEYPSGKELIAEYDKINAEYAKRSGNDVPLVHKGEIQASLLTARQAALALDRETAVAAGKADTLEQQTTLVNSLLETATTGRAKDAIQAAGGKASMVDDAFRAKFIALKGNPTAQAQLLLKDSIDGSVVSSIKSDLTAMFNSAGDAMDANFQQGYELWKTLNELKPTTGDSANHAIAGYFEDKVAARYGAFHSALAGRSVEERGESAFLLSQRVLTNPGHTFTKDERPLALGFLDKQVRGNTFFGEQSLAGNANGYFSAPKPLTSSSQQIVMSMMQSKYKASAASNSGEAAMQDSFARAQADGLEVYGSYAWKNGVGRASLESKLKFADGKGTPLTKNMIANGLNSYVETRLKTFSDKTPDDVLLVRGPDGKDGDPTFFVSALVGGVWQPETYFTGRDLVAHVHTAITEPARKAAAQDKNAVATDEMGGDYVTWSKRIQAESKANLNDRKNFQFGPELSPLLTKPQRSIYGR